MEILGTPARLPRSVCGEVEEVDEVSALEGSGSKKESQIKLLKDIARGNEGNNYKGYASAFGYDHLAYADTIATRTASGCGDS